MVERARPDVDSSSIPVGLYLHLPWCLRKCPYCDFNSYALRGELPAQDYLRALLADLEFARPAVGSRRFASVYFGGGTPSLFPPEQIAALLDWLRARRLLAADAEISLEANPGAADRGRFAAYRAAGVNRLSLGVQSFDDRSLAALGRVHDGTAARAAVAAAMEHFHCVNIDLMHGLPGQELSGALADLGTALDFGPAQIACYQLTIEPNTVFYSRPPTLPPDAVLGAIETAMLERLAAAGYEHYEISAHARPGARCRHNLNYWQFGDYLGIGAGAHSKLSVAGRILRQARLRRPESYQRRAGTANAIGSERAVDRQERIFEFMLNALRLRDGFSEALFRERTGCSLAEAGSAIARCVDRGWLETAAGGLRATADGRRWLNRLLQEFLPAPA
ncbi:MAG: radical SAM family heme chaperone HemW [Gammaproteobacteria bacterium]|nr:MAG: radical SAM family heme chaperone HemW [Gammaproteobacteria bacterium]